MNKSYKATAILFALQLFAACPAFADTAIPPSANGYPYLAVTGCGSVTITAGKYVPGFVDAATGNLCTNAAGGGGATSVSQGSGAGATSPWSVNLYSGANPNAAGFPLFTQDTIGGVAVSTANPLPVAQQGQSSTYQGASAAAAGGIVPVVASNVTALSAKTSGGNLYSVYARNLTQTQGFLVGYSAAATPTSGASLTSASIVDCVPLPAASSTVAAIPALLNYLPGPAKRYGTGIQILISSTDCAAASPVYTTGTVTAYVSAMVQ